MSEYIDGLRNSVKLGVSTVKVKSDHYKVTTQSDGGIFTVELPRLDKSTKLRCQRFLATPHDLDTLDEMLVEETKKLLADDAELIRLAELCRKEKGRSNGR